MAEHPLIEEFTKYAANLRILPEPKILFHYTSLEVATSILGSRSIWNTHILDMRNDLAEFSHGLDMFIEGISVLEGRGLDRQLGTLLKQFIDREKTDPNGAPCILCLSPVRDDLGQWREYGRRGKGVCIGFSTESIVGARNVIYQGTEKRIIVDEILESFIQLVNKLVQLKIPINEAPFVRRLSLAYFQAAYMQSLRFKTQNWAHENEWRAVILIKKDELKIHQRSDSGRKLRYCPVEIDLRKGVSELILGPRFRGAPHFPNLENSLVKKSALCWLQMFFTLPHRYKLIGKQ